MARLGENHPPHEFIAADVSMLDPGTVDEERGATASHRRRIPSPDAGLSEEVPLSLPLHQPPPGYVNS